MPLTAPYRRIHRVYTAMRHVAASTQMRAAFFCAVAVTTKWTALRTAGLFNDKTDDQHFTLFEETARMAVVKFHQLPFWNPYYCGGISGFGTPSARFVSPTFLLSIIFGTIRADTLVAVAMTLVGLEGVFRYARARGGGALGSMLVAPVFALSGYFGRWQTQGWTNFFAFELVPWALLGARMALGGSRRGSRLDDRIRRDVRGAHHRTRHGARRGRSRRKARSIASRPGTHPLDGTHCGRLCCAHEPHSSLAHR
jgi:hypothetical protein